VNTEEEMKRQETNLGLEMPVFLAIRIEFVPTGRKDTTLTSHGVFLKN
jgi:hypothetical protein